MEIDEKAVRSYNAMFRDDLEYKTQDVRDWNLKSDILVHGSPCLTADSMILTRRGYVQFDELRINDEVLTKSNTWHPINKIFNNGVHDTIYLQAEGFENIHCTLEHKFYVRAMYREWNNDQRIYERKWKEPEFVQAKDLVRSESYLGIPVIQEEIPFVTSDTEFWYMIGYYIGDGWLQTKDHSIAFAANEEKKERIRNNCSWEFRDYQNGKHCSRLVFSHREMYDWIKRTIGTGCGNKRIPMEIIMLPKKELTAFFQGYLDADGCYVEKTDSYHFTTVNRQLAYSAGLIVNKLFHTPAKISLTKTNPTTVIEGRTVNQQDYYIVRFSKTYKKQSHAIYEDGYIWYPFRKAEPGEKEPVFNMEVDTDHSYIVQGCISKNCQDFSIAGRQKGADEGSETRSSLMWETLKIIRNFGVWKPRVVIWENVKNVLSKHMKHNFDKYLKEMESMGYVNSYAVLDATNFGLPQKRQRVFTVSILGGPAFNFGKMKKRPMRPLSEFLEDSWKECHVVKSPSMLKMIGQKKPGFNGSIRVLDPDGACDCITTAQDRCPNSGVVRLPDGQYRLLTERECWRLQGFTDRDFEAAQSETAVKAGCKSGALYKQAGNSMPVPVLEEIFKTLDMVRS